MSKEISRNIRSFLRRYTISSKNSKAITLSFATKRKEEFPYMPFVFSAVPEKSSYQVVVSWLFQGLVYLLMAEQQSQTF
jgi:hypothetical protein